VAATLVVEHLDVVEQVGLRVGARRVGCAVHPLVLQAVEEAFDGSVIPSPYWPSLLTLNSTQQHVSSRRQINCNLLLRYTRS
jgi:hypothetical protein